MVKMVTVSAKQQSGKTTLVNEITSQALWTPENQTGQFDYVHVLKFAGYLYELQDFLLNRMQTLTGQPRPKKDGPLLQFLGTNWGRTNYGADVWVELLKKKVQAISDENYSTYKNNPKGRVLLLIDDERFENEFLAFPNALKVRIECPEDVRKERSAAGMWRDDVNHPSETGLDAFAAEGRFDLYLYSDPDHPFYTSPKNSAASVLYKLQSKNV